MPTVLRGRHRLEYRLQKTDRRKTLGLKVQRDGGVDVLAPHFVNHGHIRDFVTRKAAWILKRQDYFREMRKLHPPKELRNGESFPFFGRDYRLRFSNPNGAAASCRIEGDRLTMIAHRTDSAVVWQAVRDRYAELIEKRVRALIRRHSKALAVEPGRLNIVDQARRWASCAKNGDIRVSWRLAMMPLPVIEYVVVHELCHRKTHDHSPRFWRIVKSILPDYEKRRQWLRQNGAGAAFSI